MLGPLRRLAAKALEAMVHTRGDTWSRVLLPRTGFDYAAEVGDGLGSNSLMAPIMWVARAFPEARLGVRRSEDDELDPGHEMAQLVSRPNPAYSGAQLWMATVLSWCMDGNAYWLKVRNGQGKPKELWYVPHWLVEPKWDGGDFISRYDYKPGGGPPVHLEPGDVVHLRHGLDPKNVRKGLAPVWSVLREVFTDDEAANYSAALLKNMGILGVVISPKDDATVSDEDVNATKRYLEDKFTGDHRGKPIVMRAATVVQEFGFSPEKLDLGSLRNISEERVCAALGVPSAIVGFGSGLEQTKVGATMQELVKLAWTGCLIPYQNLMAADLTRALLPDFGAAPGAEADFDRSKVNALQEDRAKQAETLERGVRGGWVTVAEARKAQGLEVRPQDEVFLRPISAIEVPADGSAPAPEPAPEPAPGDDGQPAPGAKARAPMTRVQQALATGMGRVRVRLERALRNRLLAFFEKFGEQVQRAYEETAKQDDDELRVEVLFSVLDTARLRSEMRSIIGAHYVAVFNESMGIIAGLGLGVNLPDSVQLEVLAQGGTRAGLVDMTERGREKALAIIRAAREEGLGVPETARRLREAVPAGRYNTVATRAELVARTETRFAQTQSAFRAYRTMEGVTRAMILDARLGPTDAECEALNGEVVTFEEARRLLDEEHPNGTRDIVPVFGGQEGGG